MRFFTGPRHPAESLLWSRDVRFIYRLAQAVSGGRLLELESGMCIIAPASELTDVRASAIARESHSPEYGLVQVDESILEADRYLVALGAAVQQSGIADRIGMGRSLAVAQTQPTAAARSSSPTSDEPGRPDAAPQTSPRGQRWARGGKGGKAMWGSAWYQ